MSRADRSSHAMAGYSLIETVIVIAIMAGMSLLLTEALGTTQATDDYLEAASRANQKGESLTHALAALVTESRHIFQNDERGQAYLKACQLTYPIAPGTRLPIKDPRGDVLKDDGGDPRTGNALLLVREINASPCVADRNAGKQRLIDTYRMVAVYPSIAQRSVVQGTATSRDLVVWRSEAMPSYRQLIAIGDKDERESIVKDLVSRYGYTHAWDPRATVETGFFKLKSDGKIEDDPDDKFDLEEDEILSRGSRLVVSRIQLAANDDGTDVRRKALLTSDDANTWKPDGFEVKVCGPSGSRKVWLHLTVEAAAPDSRQTAVYSTTTIAHARDF